MVDPRVAGESALLDQGKGVFGIAVSAVLRELAVVIDGMPTAPTVVVAA